MKAMIQKNFFVLLAALSSAMFLIVLHGYKLAIDGDIIGDLIISYQGVSAGKILPENVFYSTGLPNLGSRMLEQIFFRMGLNFYNTYFASRLAEIVICFLSLCWLMKLIGLTRYITAFWVVLLIPTNVFFYMIFGGGFYIWSLTCSLILLCLCKCYIDKKNDGFIIIIVLFSLYKGLLGLKAVMWIMVPISLALLIYSYANKRKRYLFLGCATLISGLTGLVINEKLLLKKYAITSRTSLQYVSVEEIPDRFAKIFSELLKTFGWQKEAKLLSSAGVINIIVILFIVFIIYIFFLEIVNFKQMDGFDGIIFLFAMFSLAIITFLFAFTMTDIDARYLASPIWILVLSSSIFYVKYYNMDLRKKLVPVLIPVLLFFYIFSWNSVYTFYVEEQKTVVQEVKSVLELLNAKGFKYGYGTFWNSQLIAGGSNLEIGSANISIIKGYSELEDGFYYFRWLSPKKYYDKSYDTGKIFVLLAENEKEDFITIITNRGGAVPEIIFDDGYYTVYEMENSEMIKYIID